jgi:5'-nucleotidase
LRILIDMDGVLANWGAEWDRHAAEYLHLGLQLTDNQTSFDLAEGLSDEGKQAVYSIMNRPDFYRVLEPFEGAAEALNTMVAEGHEVFLVTSPMVTNHNCASDKLWWAEEYIGKGWAKRTIITSDKTLVKGDVLIDDKPEIHGVAEPEWKHVYYTQPYNANKDGERINDWSEWRKILRETAGARR